MPRYATLLSNLRGPYLRKKWDLEAADIIEQLARDLNSLGAEQPPQQRSREKYEAVKCNCGCSACNHWHVAPAAEVHGVRFTKYQARVIAGLLNALESEDA